MTQQLVLLQFAEGLRFSVDGELIPQSLDLVGVQYEFPGDYSEAEKPEALETDDGGWGR